MAAEVGEMAPGFTLPADDRENTVSLEGYTERGPVALFYPGDWSSICPDQIGKIQPDVGTVHEDLNEGL